MLAADIANTTAKPRMILARNRRAGSLMDDACDPERFDDPTLTSPIFQEPRVGNARALPREVN